MSRQDPFPLVRDEVQTLFQSCQNELDSRTAPQGRTLSTLDEVDMLLNDLDAAVNASKSDTSRYGLTSQDIVERERFVTMMREASKGMRLKLMSDMRPSSSSAASRGSSSTIARPFDTSKSKDAQEIQLQELAQQEIIREQDEHLETVIGTVGNLKHVALNMGTELTDQARLLDEMDDHVEFTQGRLRTAMSKVNKILRSDSETRSTIIIIILTVIVLILLLTLIL